MTIKGSRRSSDVAPFDPIRTRRTFEAVVSQIVDRIRTGTLKEGDRLPGERVLADELQVSRPTVRMAIGALVEAGVLSSELGRSGGPRVVSIWVPDDLWPPPETSSEGDVLFKVLEARRTIEPRVAQLAAARATHEHFDRLRESIELFRANVDDRVRAGQAELMFHRVMWHAADNPPLERLLISLFHELGVARDMMMRNPPDFGVALQLHEQTLAALMRGEPEDIDAAMDDHLGHLEQIAEEVLGRRAHRPLPEFLRFARAGDR